MMLRVGLIGLIVIVMLQGCLDRDTTYPVGYIKYYGQEGDHWATDIVRNEDGTFYILGTCQIYRQDKQIFLAKADQQGESIWEYQYGDNKDSHGDHIDEEAIDMEITDDGTILILSKRILDTDIDFMLLLINPNEPKLPVRSMRYKKDILQEETSDRYEAMSVTVVSNSTSMPKGYIVCGKKLFIQNTSDVFHIYFDTNLVPVPQFKFTTFQQGSMSVAMKAFPYQTDKIVVFGYTNAPYNSQMDPTHTVNYWIYILNQYGTPLLNQKISAPINLNSEIRTDNTHEYVSTVQYFPEQKYLISGFSYGTKTYPYYVKIFPQNEASPTANILFKSKLLDVELRWETTSDITQNDQTLYKVVSCPSKYGGYYSVLSPIETPGSSSILLIKVGENGQKVWTRKMGGEGVDNVGSLIEEPDGSVIILGTFTVGTKNYQKKIVLIKVNADGQFD